MTREQMIAQAVEVLTGYEPINEHVRQTLVEAIFDEVLPQVTTVTELEALPESAKVLADDGSVWSKPLGSNRWIGLSPWFLLVEGSSASSELLAHKGSLTVVWQPS